jgi:outer membrane receptor protein involved in Fe transport
LAGELQGEVMLSRCPRIKTFALCTIITWLLNSTIVCVQAQATIHITGVVVDPNGSVIQRAKVTLKRDQLFVMARTTSDEEGRFELVGPTAQNLWIEAYSPGFDLGEVWIAPGTTFPLQIVLRPHVISSDVTVTSRTPMRISETAANVVVVTTTDLTTTAAITLDDTLRQIAGFTLFRRSGSRTANPTSQGVSLRATGASGASRALVLADGVPLNDPFGGWVYWNRIPKESISQVEVLIGSASHLYGNGALGGVIDVRTRKVTGNTLSLGASYGNEMTNNASVFAAAKTNGWSGSVAAESFHTNGYVLAPASQRGLVDTEAGARDLTMHLRVEKSFGDRKSLFGAASFFGESRTNGTPLQINRTHLRQFVFGGTWQTVSADSFWARAYGGNQVYDQTFSALSADRNSETLTRVQRVPAQLFGLSVQWSRPVTRNQTLVAGFESREVRGASDELVYINGRPSSFVGAGGRERTVGAYFEDLIQGSSRLFLNVGGRIDRWRNFAALSATRPITSVNPTSVTFFSDRTENAFSPHASVVYRFNDRVSAEISMSRAFRAPTLNELYRSFRVGNVLTLSNENLRAERLTGGEAGLQVHTKNQRIVLRGNFFWNEMTRPVANVTLTATPTLITRQRQNLGRTRSNGVDLQADTNLTRRWNLSTSYLFANARLTEFPANTALEGLLLPQVPRHQFTFQARYIDPSIVTFGLQGRASSSQFDDDQNQFRLDSYFTLDAFVSRRLNQRVELFVAVENVFNQRYEVGKTPITTLGPPILVRGGFRVQLGRQ